MKNMPLVGVIAALILILMGAGAYFASESKSVTAWIPAFLGAPLFIASAVSFKEKNLKMGMHIAATIGLLGFLAPTGMLVSKAAKGELEWKLSTSCMAGMGVICLIFVLLCVKSFIDVRKAKKGEDC